MKTQISVLISKVALILMIMLASVLMPFKVDAATWGDAPIVGININLIGYDYERTATDYTVILNTSQTRWNCASSSSTMGCQTWISQNTSDVIQNTISGTVAGTYEGRNVQLYEYEIIFDKSYVGYIQTDWSGTDMGYVNNRIYVNGNIARFTATRLNKQFNITSYNLTYAPLEVIDTVRSWNIPIESYNTVIWSIGHLTFNKNPTYYYNSLNYPMFILKTNDMMINNNAVWGNCVWVFISNIWLTPQIFSDYFDTNYSLISLERIISGDYKVYKIYFNGNTQMQLNYINSTVTNFVYIPIYFGYEPTNASLDFALNFGFSNRMLDDISKIANGTSASNQQSSDLSSDTDSMQQQMNDLVGVEDSYNQQFNNSVNSIDFSNPLQQNQGLLGASNFVITVFNGLIANNPFSILIIIVCILLIGKKVIGK